MPIDINVDKHDPIITLTVKPPFAPAQDIPETHKQLNHMANRMERPIFRIYDLRTGQIDFAKLVEFLQHDTDETAGSVRDWRFKPLFVGTDKMTKMAADSLSQNQYGAIETRTFATPQAAYAHARDILETVREKRRDKQRQ